MAVDLEDLVESLQREVSPPGTDLFPDAVAAEWLGYLQDGFWEAMMDGVISGYNESEGQVTPVSGTTDMPREIQQVIVFYAGFKIALTRYSNIQSLFRAKAGPVEFETQQSAGVLKDLLKVLADKRNLLLRQLAEIGVTPTFYYDGVVERTNSILYGLGFWTN